MCGLLFLHFSLRPTLASSEVRLGHIISLGIVYQQLAEGVLYPQQVYIGDRSAEVSTPGSNWGVPGSRGSLRSSLLQWVPCLLTSARGTRNKERFLPAQR